MGPSSTLSKVLRAISIRYGGASIFLLIPLLSWNSLSISAGTLVCPGHCVSRLGALGVYLVSLRGELCVAGRLVDHLSNFVTILPTSSGVGASVQTALCTLNGPPGSRSISLIVVTLCRACTGGLFSDDA